MRSFVSAARSHSGSGTQFDATGAARDASRHAVRTPEIREPRGQPVRARGAIRVCARPQQIPGAILRIGFRQRAQLRGFVSAEGVAPRQCSRMCSSRFPSASTEIHRPCRPDAEIQCRDPMRRSNAAIQYRDPMRRSNAAIQYRDPMRRSDAEIQCGDPMQRLDAEIRCGDPMQGSNAEIRRRDPMHDSPKGDSR
jgi:hypothetical protein